MMVDSPDTKLNPSTGPRIAADGLGGIVGEHWKWFLAEGSILVVLGIIAILLPFLAGVATTLFIGWLFLFAGIVGLVFTYKQRAAPGFWWALLSSAIAVLAGLSLLFNPLAGLVSLTVILGLYFLLDGVLTILFGLDHRRQGSDRWGWVVFNGVIDLVLAGIVLAGLPDAAFWAVGIIVGIDLAFGGSTLIALALAARKSVA
jgi:uncharacterized membrane protein HdeD (DUF308 family)